MKKNLAVVVGLSLLFVATVGTLHSQVKWIVGGNMGLGITTGSGYSSTDFTFGPMAEVLFNKNIGVGTEFDITTATGTPITWANYFKYYFTIPGSNIKPYAHAGLGLVFATGGPFFFIPFGGGASFGVAKNLYVSADLTLGPEFYSVGGGFYGYSQSTTLFIITIRPGIRYEIP
ncbi:MAG: hypothetical protein HY961_22105 [Ignavibacteriae bacterium]|nr:hypothetical protein [Ignavibacteriota bacterium]